jgi:hypothetical protein
VLELESVGRVDGSKWPQALGFGDYVGLSCSELAAETKRLVREKNNRSEHLLENDEAQRQTATTQLTAVKKAIADKRC